MHIFFKELEEYYKFYLEQSLDLKPTLNLPELKIQYKDFSLWQRAYLSKDKLDRQLNYWKNKLSGYETLNLCTDMPRPHKIDYTGRCIHFEINRNTSQSLRELAKELKISLYSLLLSGYFLMLRAYSNQDDIVVGTPIANRHYSQIENLIGFFVNSLVLRVTIDTKSSIRDFIEMVAYEVTEAQQYQDLPFENLVEELKITKDLSRNPIFQVMFGVQDFEGQLNGLENDTKKSNLSNILKVYKSGSSLLNVSQFDITTFIDDSQLELKGTFNYAVSLYEEETIAGFIETYLEILTQIANVSNNKQKQEQTQISTLKYLNESQYQKIIYKANNTNKEYPDNKTIHSLFEEQVEKTPNRIAIIYEKINLTYKELNEKSNQLANFLKEKYFIEPDALIALHLDRNEQMIVAILAVLKSGGAYVPIDPSYPDERIQYILEDTNVKVILANEIYKHKLEGIINTSPNNNKIRLNWTKEHLLLINNEIVQKQLSLQSIENLTTNTKSTDLAYVLYTSGTTGKPKGTMIEHKSVVNTILSLNDVYDFSKGIKVTAFTSYVFDVSVSEFFTVLFRGGMLYLLSEEVRINPILISRYIIDNEINYVYLPPILLSELPKTEYKTLKGIIYAGEVCDKETGQYWSNKYKLYNYYGPTEATIYALGKQIINGDVNLIGSQIYNTKCYVLNYDLIPLPRGAIGELHIGGVGLARGYLNKPELTAERFIPNPFQTDEEKKHNTNTRIYKTGDLVRLLTDDNIEYIGRNDFQVKIRGYRIELAEIENALISYPGIIKSVILVKDNTTANSEISDNKYIVAYYVSDQKLDEKKIFQYLLSILPDYMVPRHFVFLNTLPLNVNGKLDRKILLEYKIDPVGGGNEYTPPSNEYEKIIAETWSKILGKEKIGMYDNFFDLGGHSILLVKMLAILPIDLRNKLNIIDIFKYPNVKLLSDFLYNREIKLVDTATKRKNDINFNKRQEIAIIGMSGRFPGADNIDEFWENIKSGKESITFFSKEELEEVGIDAELLNNPNYVRAQGRINDIKGFDSNFFGYTPAEARIMDPQHRVFLECAWEALEHAGYNPINFEGKIGIYAGSGFPTYLIEHIIPSINSNDLSNKYQLITNNTSDFLSTRVAYKLNMTGPAVNIQTACSTSLVAVHEACNALQLGDCNVALAGGISLMLLEKHGYLYQQGMILSSDGKCRAFDAEAGGTLGGQGVGIVVLKPLENAISDRDHIYAIIKGSAINNDGQNKIGFTAPSAEQQAEVIKLAQERAGVTAESITYIEAHGTGTVLGDPIEIEGLSKAFRYTTDKKQSCAIGSVKTNIGHLDAASGIAGLIKATLCLYNKTLVPSLHYNTPNPKINFAESPFYVNTQLKSWDRTNHQRRAGVSSFGMGGTNAHVVLEESPNMIDEEQLRLHQLITLSAHSPEAFKKQAKNLANHLNNSSEMNLEKVAYTLHLGRRKFKYGSYVVAKNIEEAVIAIEKISNITEEISDRPVIMMFSGQGSQYINMGHQLYETEAYFKRSIDKCVSIAKKYISKDVTVQDILGRTERINQTCITQPALFIIEYSLAQYFIYLGIKPYAMIGHSIGEYVAACLSGVFSLEDALATVIIRGRLIQSLPDDGKMLAIPCSQEFVRDYLKKYDDLDIAVVNTTESCVVSGPNTSIIKFNDELKFSGIECKYLHTSHAFHSRMLNPILADFYNAVIKIKLNKPNIPFISNVNGKWINDNQVVSAKYWVDHLRNTVLFSQGLECLLKTDEIKNGVFIEVGPNQVLTSFVKTHPAKHENNLVISSMKRYNDKQEDNQALLHALGNLYSAGVKIDWHKFYERNIGRVPLPQYPFERQSYWIPAKNLSMHAQSKELERENLIEVKPTISLQETLANDTTELIVTKIWNQILGIQKINIHDDFFELGGNSLMSIQLADQIKKQLKVQLDLASLGDLTIYEITKIIENQKTKIHSENIMMNNSPNIVIMKQGEPNKLLPLVLIHPIGGEVYLYRDLIAKLSNEQTVYAIRSPLLNGRTSFTSLEEMAEFYLQEVSKFGINPPYILGGASFGGIVAFHMAKILYNRDIDIPFIVLIDSPNYDNMPKPLNSSEILEHLVNYLSRQLKISEKELHSINHQESQIQYIKDRAKKLELSEILTSILPSEFGKNFINTWQVNQNVMMKYTPTPYLGTIINYCHTEVIPEFSTDNHLYWFKLAKGNFNNTFVPGDHISMNMKPNVDIIAISLKKIIEYESDIRLNKAKNSKPK